MEGKAWRSSSGTTECWDERQKHNRRGTTAGDRGRGAATLFMSDVLGPGIWVLGSYGHVFIGLSFKPSFVYSTFFSPLRARSLRHFTTLHSTVLASSFFTN